MKIVEVQITKKLEADKSRIVLLKDSNYILNTSFDMISFQICNINNTVHCFFSFSVSIIISYPEQQAR